MTDICFCSAASARGMMHDMAAISGVSLAAYIMEQVIAADTYAAVSCAVGEGRNIWVL